MGQSNSRNREREREREKRENKNSENRYNRQFAEQQRGVSNLEIKKNIHNITYQQNELQLKLLEPKFANLNIDIANQETAIAQLNEEHTRKLGEISSTYDNIKNINGNIPIKARFESALRRHAEEQLKIKNEMEALATNLGMDQTEYERQNLIINTKYYEMIHKENENIMDTLRDFQSELKQYDKAFINEQNNNNQYYYPTLLLLIIYYICVVVFMFVFIYSGPFSNMEYYYKFFIYICLFFILCIYPYVIYPIEKYVINYIWWVYCFFFNIVYTPLEIFT